MRKYPGVIVGLLCSLAFAGTVLAEGVWESHMANVLPGFESRTWTDGNLDNAATEIRFSTCRDAHQQNGAADWASAKLMREIPILPDEDRGNKRFDCWVTDVNSWGDVPAANYHFTLTGRSGPNELWNNLDVALVRTRY